MPPRRSARPFLWTYADRSSVTTTDGGVHDKDLLENFETQYGVKPWNATITRVLMFITVRMSAVTNTLGAINMLLATQTTDYTQAILPAYSEAADFMFWRRQYISGPGGDSTALVNVMPPYLFEFDVQTQRVINKPEETLVFWILNNAGANIAWAASFRTLLRMP